jgi:hypothetical protein
MLTGQVFFAPSIRLPGNQTDEAIVARARKAMAIALTALDDQDKTTTT